MTAGEFRKAMSKKFMEIENNFSIDPENYKHWIDITKECYVSFMFLKKLIDYRNNEKNENKKHVPYKKIGELIIKNINMIDLTEDEEILIQTEIMKDDFELPKIEYNNFEKYAKYTIVLSNIFQDIYNAKVDVPKITLKFVYILLSIQIKLNVISKQIDEAERQADRNSKNSSTRTPAKIEDYKKHDLYPQLEQMIKSYRETPKEIRELNKIVGEIIGTDNRVTIKRYRYLFFQEIQKG